MKSRVTDCDIKDDNSKTSKILLSGVRLLHSSEEAG